MAKKDKKEVVKEVVEEVAEEPVAEEAFSTKIMQDGTRYKVYPDGKEELIKE